ncbi:Aste57867_17996 [Aphanomyces stellatus]|uniref:Aste57867_16180 protein n=1 Tax=Aphanomyces stellatus TaxID=120398 RepID=A0A485LCK6_9STRA|nr:hypothetical protein As57867_017934 [Aphanomyces stellatus]KAF0692762.1 hypothetical protein As57867_016124 [Aphanomyces stellatus]VFT92958.1 Aste57867_16180 [Aphanomyces stellatus]VFT94735.1 Aste57867_17996 [Aphanomyces stellatus]
MLVDGNPEGNVQLVHKHMREQDYIINQLPMDIMGINQRLDQAKAVEKENLKKSSLLSIKIALVGALLASLEDERNAMNIERKAYKRSIEDSEQASRKFLKAAENMERHMLFCDGQDEEETKEKV